MLETKIEKELTARVKSLGGLSWKLVSPGTRGVPDRICILPDGRTIYVELKRPGEKPEALQEYRHKQLRDRGHTVYVIDSIQGVYDLIREVSNS